MTGTLQLICNHEAQASDVASVSGPLPRCRLTRPRLGLMGQHLGLGLSLKLDRLVHN